MQIRRSRRKIIFGIHHFWIQHTQIDLKSHRYRFSPHLHLTSLSRPLFQKWTLSNTPFDLNSPSEEMLARQRAEACILEIKSWMSLNKLKLNDEKDGIPCYDF